MCTFGHYRVYRVKPVSKIHVLVSFPDFERNRSLRTMLNSSSCWELHGDDLSKQECTIQVNTQKDQYIWCANVIKWSFLQNILGEMVAVLCPSGSSQSVQHMHICFRSVCTCQFGSCSLGRRD